MSLPLRSFFIAAALMMVLPSCVQHQSGSAAPSAFLQTSIDKDYPALLLEKIAVVGHHSTDDLDRVYHVSCCVLYSHKTEAKAGDSVVLYVPSGSCKDERAPAERTRYWLVSGQGDNDWMLHGRPEKVSGQSYIVNALDFHGFDAEQELLPVHASLQGVWKEMADIVAERKKVEP